MPSEESARLWSVPHLNGLNLLRANFVTYSFKRHMHDYFVFGMVEDGVQRFDKGRSHFITLPAGLIVLNPAEPHTGEAAVEDGFRYRALYPEAETMQAIAADVRGQGQDVPYFPEAVITDPALCGLFLRLHRALEQSDSTLEHTSRFTWVMAQFIVRHSADAPLLKATPPERPEIRRIRRYIEDRFAENILLADLAALVNWNPFYLLRVFRETVGLPPHAYLETVRIRRAQQFLRQNMPLVDVAYATGFSSQSHFTTSFKNLIGVTPGQFVQQVNFLKDGGPPPKLS